MFQGSTKIFNLFFQKKQSSLELENMRMDNWDDRTVKSHPEFILNWNSNVLHRLDATFSVDVVQVFFKWYLVRSSQSDKAKKVKASFPFLLLLLLDFRIYKLSESEILHLKRSWHTALTNTKHLPIYLHLQLKNNFGQRLDWLKVLLTCPAWKENHL